MEWSFVLEHVCAGGGGNVTFPGIGLFRGIPFIINISMYFVATEKWHVQMVMVSCVVQLAGALDAPSGTRVSNRPVYAVISVMPDVLNIVLWMLMYNQPKSS